MAQRLLFLKFGVTGETENGRRVDLLLKEGDLEILNTEAKSAEDGGLCEIQYKKNVRINHTIHREASRKGIELATMLPLDIRGRRHAFLFGSENRKRTLSVALY